MMNRLVKLIMVAAVLFYNGTVLPAGLVAHWTMNDNTASTTVTDSSTNGYNGTANKNTALLHTDSGNYPHLNGAFKFDGTNDYINCGVQPGLTNFTAKTVLIWFKASAYTGTTRYLYDNGYWTSSYGDTMYLYKDSNNIYFGLRRPNGDVASQAEEFTPGEWVMAGYSWDGTNVYYYKNGINIGSDAFTGTLACASYDFVIGRENGARFYFDGEMDSIRIYDEALSESEILQIYKDDLPLPDLVAHWKLNDNADNTTVTETVGIPGNTATAIRNTSLMHTNSYAAAGNLGGAFAFDGTSDYVVSGDSGSLRDFSQRSVFLWMKASTAHTGTDRQIFYTGYWSSPFGDHIYLFANIDQLRIALRNTSGSVTAQELTVPDDEWFMLGYSWDGTNATYYINTNAVGTKAFSGPMNCGGGVYMGNDNAHSYYYDGALDDVRIYSKALSGQEVSALYNSAYTKGTIIVVK